MRITFPLIAALITAVIVVACRPATAPGPTGADNVERPVVVATTTMLADLALQLGGDAFEVHSVMTPGGDPHLYRPTPSDARLISGSRLVLRNGLHLEGWLDDLVANAGGERPIVTASEGVDAIRMAAFASGEDPHFWFDPSLWRTAADNVSDALVALAGPGAAADAIAARHEAYDADLQTLASWAGEAFGSIPSGRAVLVTSHDAFNYLGRAYSFEVHGVQGLSTEQEAAQRDVAETIDLVRSHQVSAVFIETSVNPAIVQRIAAETGARTLGPLYSDSLGDAESGADTYFRMFRANVTMIVEGLGGTVPPWPLEGRR